MNYCKTTVTPEQAEAMRSADAVVIVIVERDDGTKTGTVTFVGSKAECEAEADRPEIVLVFSGTKSISAEVALCSELLIPEEG